MNLDDHSLQVTCQCGHQFAEKLGRFQGEGKVTCAGCGRDLVISDEQIASARAQVEATVSAAKEKLRKSFGDAFRKR